MIIVAIAAAVAAAAAVPMVVLLGGAWDAPPAPRGSADAALGLVINTPRPEITLRDLDGIFEEASSTGIGRSNAYMFWDIVEPERGAYDWAKYDGLMALHEKNGLKVTLFFSVINGQSMGPFPAWIGNPSVHSVPADRLAAALNSVLSRYHIIDSVIFAAGTDEHFRHRQADIPVYEGLFEEVYDMVKKAHPDVMMGSSFELHNTLNKNLEETVAQLPPGDFVAVTYQPTDALNEINRTPAEAISDLERLAEMFPDSRLGIFEVGWSTSGMVGGSAADQALFIKMLYGEYYDQYGERLEFLTWYRLYDRQAGTCHIEEPGAGSMGNSTFVVQRLGEYVCNAGLLDVDGSPKPGWAALSDGIGPPR